MNVFTVDIGSFKASIGGTPAVVDAVRQAFPPAPCRPPVRHAEPKLRIDVQEDGDDTWRIVEDETVTHHCHGFTHLYSTLVWLINIRAVEWLGREHQLFHAAAVAFGETGIVLPGRSGSGKSTLTAALVAEGFTYYSDEAAVIAPGCGSMLPFPKAIKLEPESISFLLKWYPNLATAPRRPRDAGGCPTYLHPPDQAWPSAPATPKLVIFPRYERGAQTRLRGVSRSAAFERLMDHAFSAGQHGALGIHQNVQLVQGCTCYELKIGDLNDAVRLMTQIAR